MEKCKNKNLNDSNAYFKINYERPIVFTEFEKPHKKDEKVEERAEKAKYNAEKAKREAEKAEARADKAEKALDLIMNGMSYEEAISVVYINAENLSFGK